MLSFGDLVLQKYRILRNATRRDGLLGRGAFGSVYLAHEQPADRLVAIKTLTFGHEDSEDRDEAVQRFLTEGRLGLRVRHPNILEVYVIEPYEDGYLLVMELAEGGDVKTLLQTARPTFAQTVAITAGIAEGLQAAHDQGIVHRDLKPGNVFLLRDGTPKVADFGVAHIPQALGGYHNLTRTGFQPGTIIYMSPEQAAGRRLDRRSDLYTLAVILFECLTGRFYIDLDRCRAEARSRSVKTPSLEEFHFFQVFSEMAFAQPPPHPRAIDPAIPEWLDAIVVRGLAREPDDRWQSGHECAAALRSGTLPHDDRPLSLPPPPRAVEPDPAAAESPTVRVVRDRQPATEPSVAAAPLSTATTARSGGRRHGPLAFGAASLVLLLLLAGGGFLVAHGRSGHAPAAEGTTAPNTTLNPATVPDSAVTPAGTTLVQRLNVPGQNGDPGYITVETRDNAATGGCTQPHIDLLRPNASGVWASVWDGASQPNGAPLIAAVVKNGADCFPQVTQLTAQALAPGGQPLTLVVVTNADRSVRLLALNYVPANNAVKMLYELHTTPHGQIALNLTPPAQLTVSEDAFPPSTSGLEPQNDKPIGTLRLAFSWANSTFNAAGQPQFTPGCSSGTVVTVASGALLLQCPSGSAAAFAAAGIDGATVLEGSVTLAALAPGDDVTLAYDSGAPPTDPQQQLPHAATLSSRSAGQRLAPTPSPTPSPTAAPTQAPTRAPTASGYAAPVASATRYP